MAAADQHNCCLYGSRIVQPAFLSLIIYDCPTTSSTTTTIQCSTVPCREAKIRRQLLYTVITGCSKLGPRWLLYTTHWLRGSLVSNSLHLSLAHKRTRPIRSSAHQIDLQRSTTSHSSVGVLYGTVQYCTPHHTTPHHTTLHYTPLHSTTLYTDTTTVPH